LSWLFTIVIQELAAKLAYSPVDPS